MAEVPESPEVRSISPPTHPAPAEPSKRRWFTRGVLGVTAAGIAGLFAAHHARHAMSATDREGGHRHHGWKNKSPEELAQRLQKGADKLLDRLDATPEQRARIKPMVDAAFKDLMPLRDLRHTLREDAVKILTAETVDRNALEALRARQLERVGEASKRLTTALADIAGELNVSQKSRIAQFAASRGRGERGERGGRRWFG